MEDFFNLASFIWKNKHHKNEPEKSLGGREEVISSMDQFNRKDSTRSDREGKTERS